MQRNATREGEREGNKGRRGSVGQGVSGRTQQGGSEGKENMVYMERRLKGGRKEGRQGMCPRHALHVSTNAAALPCECHRVRVLYVKAPRYQQSVQCTSSPMRYQGGVKGREDGRGERPPYATQCNAGGRETKEGGGLWDKACWAVRISLQHRQRRPQRQSAAASKRQRPARQSGSKR